MKKLGSSVILLMFVLFLLSSNTHLVSANFLAVPVPEHTTGGGKVGTKQWLIIKWLKKLGEKVFEISN